jgi:hypothetical protein
VIRQIAPALLASCLLILAACGGNGDSDTTPTPALRTPPPPLPADTPPLPSAFSIGLFAAEPGDSATAAAFGDFNADGQLDAAVGAALADGPANERPDSGEVYVFLGPLQRNTLRDAGLGEQDLTVYGGDSGDQAGRSLASGDINGDGVADLVVGSPLGDGPAGDRADAGELVALFGGPAFVPESGVLDLRDGAPFAMYGAEAEDLFAFTIDTADTSGDGVADLLTGAFWADGPGNARDKAGEAYAIFGGALPGSLDLANAAPNVVVYGASATDQLGEALAAGDVNGDGIADLALAAPFAPSTGGAADAGRTYVILGPPAATIDLASDAVQATIVGTDDGDQLGHSIAVDDNDGDGLGDVLLGAVSADGLENAVDLAGEVTLILATALTGVVDTANGGATATIYGVNQEDRLGRSVAFFDLDGDGDMEPAMAAPGSAGAKNARPEAGEVYVMQNASLSGSIPLPDLAVSFQGSAGDMAGSSVTGKPSVLAVDVDGDNRQELVVGSPGSDGPDGSRPDAGAVFILFVQ